MNFGSRIKKVNFKEDYGDFLMVLSEEGAFFTNNQILKFMGRPNVNSIVSKFMKLTFISIAV